VNDAGGAGAALRHYEQTGSKYPLVVKLGTITPHSADVYSYSPDEDDMVTDPLLKEHLAHWGINMMQMEKTDKTMAELQACNASLEDNFRSSLLFAVTVYMEMAPEGARHSQAIALYKYPVCLFLFGSRKSGSKTSAKR
jgi:hypothetical protein